MYNMKFLRTPVPSGHTHTFNKKLTGRTANITNQTELKRRATSRFPNKMTCVRPRKYTSTKKILQTKNDVE